MPCSLGSREGPAPHHPRECFPSASRGAVCRNRVEELDCGGTVWIILAVAHHFFIGVTFLQREPAVCLRIWLALRVDSSDLRALLGAGSSQL